MWAVFLALPCWKNSVAGRIVVVMQRQGAAPAPDPHCVFQSTSIFVTQPEAFSLKILDWKLPVFYFNSFSLMIPSVLQSSPSPICRVFLCAVVGARSVQTTAAGGAAPWAARLPW